jgi:hypothetical protein
MRTSTIIRTTSRNLAYELVGIFYHKWQAAWRRGHANRSAKKISGYIAAVIGISLAVDVILSAPQHRSDDHRPGHQVVNGLHIAVPDNFRDIAVEQLVPLP